MGEIKAIKKSVAELKTIQNRLNKIIKSDKLMQTIDELQTKISDLEAALDESKNQIKKKEDLIDDLFNKLEERDDRIHLLKKQEGVISKKLKKAENKLLNNCKQKKAKKKEQK